MAENMTYETIAKTLFETYESIYDIDLKDLSYRTYHESDSYRKLRIEKKGEDFFAVLNRTLPRVISPEDREYVSRMLERETLVSGVRKEKYYSFFYRIQKGEKDIYHQLRAVLRPIEGGEHILLGVRNVDALIRREQEHLEEIRSMHQKEKNYLAAILGSSAGYLEANLTTDAVIEVSPFFASSGGFAGFSTEKHKTARYSEFEEWICKQFVVEGTDKYMETSRREYLLDLFEKGEKRASVFFCSRTEKGESQPCKKVFYLYRDNATGDVHSFCVLYDLTEQQKKEMEMERLEEELRMSRIRNSTSQMQPHFLYNALGSIQEIVLEDPQYASDLIGDFTTHLRSCVRAMVDDRPLSFSQELENIRAYLNIEKMRFGKKLKVRYEIGAEEFPILPLSIQPLVENAVRHGIYGRGVRGGTLTVRSREEEDRWVVEVEDNGVGFDVEVYRREMAEGHRDSAGLKNIIFRLEKVMQGRVEIESKIGTGTRVTVLIPKGERKE